MQRRQAVFAALALPWMHKATMSQTTDNPTSADPYLWLEDVQGERALAWVRQRNAETEAALQSQPGFAQHLADLRAALRVTDGISDIALGLSTRSKF